MFLVSFSLWGLSCIQEEGWGLWSPGGRRRLMAEESGGALQRAGRLSDPCLWICWLKPAFDFIQRRWPLNERPQSSCAWKCLPLSEWGWLINWFHEENSSSSPCMFALACCLPNLPTQGCENVLGNPFSLGAWTWVIQYGLCSTVQPFRLYLEIFSVLIQRPVYFNTFLPE